LPWRSLLSKGNTLRLLWHKIAAKSTTLCPEKEKEEGESLPLTFPALVSLGGQDLTAIVGAASLASSVGHNRFTALGANSNAGSGQLPVAATALIATGLGHFTLRDSHG
jgi:hypothetical protein